jgi:hypothetical protein
VADNLSRPGDPVQIERCFWNWAQRSRRMPAGGTLTVSTEMAELPSLCPIAGTRPDGPHVMSDCGRHRLRHDP